MGQVLHGSARTTAAVRRAIQNSQESLRALADRYAINPKTVAKWKKRSSVEDLRTGPKDPRSTVLSAEDEAIIVAFAGLSDILCLRRIPSLIDESVAEDDGELRSCVEPFPRRPFPVVGGMIEHEI